MEGEKRGVKRGSVFKFVCLFGRPARTLLMMSHTWATSAYGSSREKISQMITPRLYTSAAAPYSADRLPDPDPGSCRANDAVIISGARHSRLPRTLAVILRPSDTRRLCPKSPIFTMYDGGGSGGGEGRSPQPLPPPSASECCTGPPSDGSGGSERKMFSGLRSRWTTSTVCK